MYEMRNSIRDDQTFAVGQARATRIAGDLSESMLYEALLARDPDDGQTLLMYAVRWGRESWFLDLVHHIQEQVQVLARVLERASIDSGLSQILASPSHKFSLKKHRLLKRKTSFSNFRIFVCRVRKQARPALVVGSSITICVICREVST